MGLKKTFRVSWASAPNLCQVKHFLQEDCPSKVGRGSQHHHRSKQSHLSSIRPSFGGRSCLKQPKETRPYNPQAKWKCPPKFNLNGNWCVVAGEESKEAEAQNHRVKRVLEAVYPFRSAIPSNPITSVDLDKSYDDSRTQVIPSIPIEEVTDVEVSCHLTPSHNTCSELSDPCPPNSSSSSSFDTCQNLMIPPSNSTFSSKQPAPSRCQVSPKPPVNHNPLPQYSSTCENLHLESNQISLKPVANGIDVPQCQSNENPSVPLVKRPKTQICSNPPANEKPVVEISDGLDGNTVLAAAAAVIALAKSKEPSSLIDADFLIKLLSNPEQIQRLMNEHGLASNMKTESKPIGGCDNKKIDDTNSQVFSLPSEVRNTNKQRQTAAVDLLTPLCVTKPGKPVNKHQGIKTLALPTPDLSLERFKKLINEYGAPDNVSSDMVVSPRANLPIASQPELQRKLYSQHALSFPLMTSPAPLHKDDNYYKSLIKQHGKNCESSEQLLQNTNLLNVEHCNFFTSPTGCLNGSSSSFLHKLSKQWRPGEMVQAPASKKMKLGGELTGWT